jgi:hypothetical protein
LFATSDQEYARGAPAAVQQQRLADFAAKVAAGDGCADGACALLVQGTTEGVQLYAGTEREDGALRARAAALASALRVEKRMAVIVWSCVRQSTLV